MENLIKLRDIITTMQINILSSGNLSTAKEYVNNAISDYYGIYKSDRIIFSYFIEIAEMEIRFVFNDKQFSFNEDSIYALFNELKEDKCITD